MHYLFFIPSGGGIDYFGFNELITMLPMSSRFEFNVTVKADDDITESIETFTAKLSLDQDGPIRIAAGGDIATVSIHDFSSEYFAMMIISNSAITRF